MLYPNFAIASSECSWKVLGIGRYYYPVRMLKSWFLLLVGSIPVLLLPFSLGVVLRERLHWTEMIYSHGLELLSNAPSPYLQQQVSLLEPLL